MCTKLESCKVNQRSCTAPALKITSSSKAEHSGAAGSNGQSLLSPPCCCQERRGGAEILLGEMELWDGVREQVSYSQYFAQTFHPGTSRDKWEPTAASHTVLQELYTPGLNIAHVPRNSNPFPRKRHSKHRETCYPGSIFPKNVGFSEK